MVRHILILSCYFIIQINNVKFGFEKQKEGVRGIRVIFALVFVIQCREWGSVQKRLEYLQTAMVKLQKKTQRYEKKVNQNVSSCDIKGRGIVIFPKRFQEKYRSGFCSSWQRYLIQRKGDRDREYEIIDIRFAYFNEKDREEKQ